MIKEKVVKPKFPKLEGVIASEGHNYTTLGDAHGMGGQAFRRRMNGDTEFTLDEIVWLCGYFGRSFSELFDYSN